ncbi:hypothetical protein ACLB1N_32330 [Escherichia coli]
MLDKGFTPHPTGREQEEINACRVRRSRSPAKRINNNYTRDPAREMSGRSPK